MFSHCAVTILLVGLGACGGQPVAGPSPVAVAPPPGTVTSTTPAAPTPRPFPAGVDPDYVRALAIVDAAGIPKRWDGGPFHHCLAPEVDRAVVEPVLAEMSAISGVPRTEAGPCNVQWTADYGRRDHSYADLAGTATAIVSARVFLFHEGSDAHHEAGHVLGLAHSPRQDDLMSVTPRVDAFSRDELAVLAWMYAR